MTEVEPVETNPQFKLYQRLPDYTYDRVVATWGGSSGLLIEEKPSDTSRCAEVNSWRDGLKTVPPGATSSLYFKFIESPETGFLYVDISPEWLAVHPNTMALIKKRLDDNNFESYTYKNLAGLNEKAAALLRGGNVDILRETLREEVASIIKESPTQLSEILLNLLSTGRTIEEVITMIRPHGRRPINCPRLARAMIAARIADKDAVTAMEINLRDTPNPTDQDILADLCQILGVQRTLAAIKDAGWTSDRIQTVTSWLKPKQP